MDPLPTSQDEMPRVGLSVAAIRQGFLDNLRCLQAKFPAVATLNDYYLALGYTVRDRLLDRWEDAASTYLEQRARTVCYLSAEYLLGPHLQNNMLNLGIQDEVREAITSCDLDLDRLIAQEEEPGLGNGGLGRLAACYMDSLASLEIAAIGYGIYYEFGIFRQEIRNGWQHEATDKWLRMGNPWTLPRPGIKFDVRFGGHTESRVDEHGRYRVFWIPEQVVQGTAQDTPILGYRVNTANLLRLWKAEAAESFDFGAFNMGDYYRAVDAKITSENITKVLYPNDQSFAGKRLRLQQQYFFVSCALQDMLRLYSQTSSDMRLVATKFAVQLNDTHPAIAVAEWMRMLVDTHHLEWDVAWNITQKTFSYTNHTLLPEALETWSLELFGKLLPRHLEIIYEINQRFLNQVRIRYPNDPERASRMSLIGEGDRRCVRMANLACVGSHAINGVAKLHTELLKSQVLRDFHDMWPEKFTNKTNGVTPRRFVALSNPGLAKLLNEVCGSEWPRDLTRLEKLEAHADDPDFQERWQRVKHNNKVALARVIHDRTGVVLSENTMFCVHAKRLHEYKRQHLAVLHIISLYNRLRRREIADFAPRSFIFAGKAAPGYANAKLIIRLIHAVAEVVNSDPAVDDLLRVVFFPNFNVTNGQRIYPAADLSLQIPTAGKEASGTGNMKLSLNGALTIGTLDGANIEIRDAVGADNFFLFGLTAEEVHERQRCGADSRSCVANDPDLQEALQMINEGFFSPEEHGLFRPLFGPMPEHDPYMVLADFRAYADCQDRVACLWADPSGWRRLSILNTARMGYFSSDRAILEYCRDIWRVKPMPIQPR